MVLRRRGQEVRYLRQGRLGMLAGRGLMLPLMAINGWGLDPRWLFVGLVGGVAVLSVRLYMVDARLTADGEVVIRNPWWTYRFDVSDVLVPADQPFVETQGGRRVLVWAARQPYFSLRRPPLVWPDFSAFAHEAGVRQRAAHLDGR
jgi:hypothetical protein